MWLERSVMFPALHSTIRDVLDSNEATKVQFILEPLALPLLFQCFKIHGQRFIEQLSYLTRTFAFSVDKEYRKIVKLAKESPPLSQPAYNVVNSNLISVSAAQCSPPSLARPDLPSQGRLQCAEHCEPGLQTCISGAPVHSTAAPSTTSLNDTHSANESDRARYENDPCDGHGVGAGGGVGVMAGQVSDSLPCCVVGRGGGRCGGGVGSAAAVRSLDSGARPSGQHLSSVPVKTVQVDWLGP